MLTNKSQNKLDWKQILIVIFSILITFLFVIILVWVILQGLFNISKEALGAISVVIAAMITAWLGFRSSLKSKQVEKEKEIEQELRKQKAPIYEEFTNFLFKILKEQKKEKEIPQEEMIEFIMKFNQKLIVWGGDDVIKSWANFRLVTHNENYVVLFAVEDILFSIRYDMGHSNKELKRGDLLALFINDIGQILDESK